MHQRILINFISVVVIGAFLLSGSSALADEPDLSQAIKALRMIDAGNSEDGLVQLEEYVLKNPEEPVWQLNLANLLSAQAFQFLKNSEVSQAQIIYAKAKGYCQKAIELFDPENNRILLSEAYFLMGKILHYGEDDISSAKEYYQKALKIYHHPHAQEAINRLQ